MSKKDWFWVVFTLFACWFVDRITKEWAYDLKVIHNFYDLISLFRHQNHGALLGLFSDLPAVLRIVTLSTTGVFLLSVYIFLQYVLPIKSMRLRLGMSFLVGGILGNVTDRIIWGYVIDFIVLGPPKLTSPAFNLADALQWVGYALIVIALIREGQLLWPENDVRKKFWVNKKFQLKYCFILVSIGVSLSLVGLVFSYTYLRVTMVELVGAYSYLLDKFLDPFVISFILMGVIFCGALFIAGKIISHRIAGPLYAFERYLNDILEGKEVQLRLRAGDEFKHLEELAQKISLEIKKIKEQQVIQVIQYQETLKDSASEREDK